MYYSSIRKDKGMNKTLPECLPFWRTTFRILVALHVVAPRLLVAIATSTSFDPDQLIYVNVYKNNNRDPNTQPSTNLTIFTHENRNVYLLQSTFGWSVQVANNNYNDNNNNNNNSSAISHYVAPRLVRTSQQALQHACQWATNGGPFHADGTSVGIVVSNGHMIHESYGGIGFGLYDVVSEEKKQQTQKQQQQPPQWVLGKLINASQTVGLQHFVTGFDWLVWEGTNVVADFNNNDSSSNNSNNATNALVVKSARTAVGIDSEGKLVMLVADGCEKCLRYQGLKLTVLADLLIGHGVRHAINMDGGGSSVLVQQHGKVLSHPTCLDVPIPCERAVSSILCLKNDMFKIIEEEKR